VYVLGSQLVLYTARRYAVKSAASYALRLSAYSGARGIATASRTYAKRYAKEVAREYVKKQNSKLGYFEKKWKVGKLTGVILISTYIIYLIYEIATS